MSKEETILKELWNTKHLYEGTEIPPELEERIEWAMNQGTRKRKAYLRNGKARRIRRSITKYAATAAAVLAVVFVTGLNTSESFAAAMEDSQILGGISRVLIFRSYEEQDADKLVVVEQPEVQPREDAEQVFVTDINAEIEHVVEAYKLSAEQNIAEYKEHFLATGGTEEVFAGKNIRVDVNYEVKYESDTALSLVLTANESWSNALGKQYFYNLDMKEQKDITLADLLGEDWAAMADAQILEQMQEREAAEGVEIYWLADKSGFAGVTEETNFYINENGNPVVVFAKYEVAPGSYGVQEFEIRK